VLHCLRKQAALHFPFYTHHFRPEKWDIYPLFRKNGTVLFCL